MSIGGLPPVVIGGIAVGTAGTGIYTNYTMQDGDDFDGPLDIVQVDAPLAKYFPTKVYSAGGRTNQSNLFGYDVDPYFTGAQDSNRGVPVGFTNMSQANSVLRLLAKAATVGEAPFLSNGKNVTDAMVHGGGFFGVSCPCIMEISVTYTAPGGQTDWHPTSLWTLNDNPLDNPGSGSPGWLEWDLGEGWGPSGFNYNSHGTVTPISGTVNAGNFSFVSGTKYLITIIMDATGAQFYVNTTASGTKILQDCTNTLKSLYPLFTNHITAYTAAQWNSSQQAILDIDFWRCWVPTANTVKTISPIATPSPARCDYNTSLSFTFPTAAAIWGAGVVDSDYCQVIKNEDFEPGSTGEAVTNYNFSPANYTLSQITRVLAGANNFPGRMHLAVRGYKAGGVVVRTYRTYVDIGPNITLPTQNLTNGVPYSLDIWPFCNCGTLSKNMTIAVTGLPTGLTFVFDGVNRTAIISGTPTVNGTVTPSVTVTNYVSQSQTKTPNFITASVVALAIDGTPVTNSQTGTTITATVSNTLINGVVTVIIPISGAITITSITSTSGLTFTKRGETGLISGGGNFQVYTAPSTGVLTNEVISVHMSASTTARIIAWCTAGVGNLASQFDANGSVPGAGVWVSHTNNTIAISTNFANDMTFAFLNTVGDHSGSFVPPAGWTNLIVINGFYSLYYKVQTATLTSQNVAFSWSGALSGGMYVDAFKGN